VQTIAGASSQSSATGWYLVAGVSMGLAKSVASVLEPAAGARA
jgi:hypothetical protein